MEKSYLNLMGNSAHQHLKALVPSLAKGLDINPVSSKFAQLVQEFSLILVTGAVLPGVRVKNNNRKLVRPNLYLGVVGSAGSGKSQMEFIKWVLQPLEEHFSTLPQLTNQKTHPPRMVNVPVDTSRQRLYQHVESNEDNGVNMMYNSEMNSALRSFTDSQNGYREEVRQALEHESWFHSTKGNNDSLRIEEPFLSIGLAGTYEQAKSILEKENGTLSRFLIIFNNDVDTSIQEEFEDDLLDQDEKDIKQLYQAYGSYFLELWKFYSNNSLHIGFSKEQKKILEDFKALYKEPMVNEFGLVAEGIVHRHMLFVRKMGGALTAAMIFENDQKDIKDMCHCDSKAFELALSYATISISFVQEFLRGSNKLNMSREDKELFSALSTSFTTKQLRDQIEKFRPDAKSSSLAKMASRRITCWINQRLIQKVKTGEYQKLTG
jgi:hypothetical protein